MLFELWFFITVIYIRKYREFYIFSRQKSDNICISIDNVGMGLTCALYNVDSYFKKTVFGKKDGGGDFLLNE